MLIFLVAIYLVVNITCIVMLAMGFEHIVGSKLYLWIKKPGSSDKYQKNFSSTASMSAHTATRKASNN
jgi:hypothetical protein